MQRISILENGLVGAFFLPAGPGPHPLIIAIGGFRGGANEARAEMLSSFGFASLSLAYFGCPNLPPLLQEIPIEYFERAIDCAARHPNVDPKRIALWGVSRGAEISLLLASKFPERIAALVATLPSSAIYGSIQSDAPAWTYKGRPVAPNAPFPKVPFSMEGKEKERPLVLTPYFLEGMKDSVAFSASIIPVEKIQCPLLLVSAEDDQMWPSSLFACQIVERLQSQGSRIPSTHLSYPRAGHSISSSDEIVELHPIVKIWFAFGGTRKDNALAKKDSQEKTIRFFKKWLS
jgi:dienelactone hydrolase